MPDYFGVLCIKGINMSFLKKKFQPKYAYKLHASIKKNVIGYYIFISNKILFLAEA